MYNLHLYFYNLQNNIYNIYVNYTTFEKKNTYYITENEISDFH